MLYSRANNPSPLIFGELDYTVVWSSLGHPLGSTQKVPCRRRCLTGDPFIHCKLAKWEQPKGALQAKVPYRGGALQGHDHSTMSGHFGMGKKCLKLGTCQVSYVSIILFSYSQNPTTLSRVNISSPLKLTVRSSHLTPSVVSPK